MCDLVKNETERIDATFLEPACGDGNFLVEILRRKLAVVKSRYGKRLEDFTFQSIRALMSLYGIDILEDNVEACRERLFSIWFDCFNAEMRKHGATDEGNPVQAVARFVLKQNILLGNTLSMKRVDGTGNDLEEPIIFTEWTFPRADRPVVKRRSFRLDTLQRDDGDSLFAWAERENNAFIPVPIREWPMVDYRELPCPETETERGKHVR